MRSHLGQQYVLRIKFPSPFDETYASKIITNPSDLELVNSAAKLALTSMISLKAVTMSTIVPCSIGKVLIVVSN